MVAATRIVECIFYLHQNKTNVTCFSHDVTWNKSQWTFEANALLCGCKENCEVCFPFAAPVKQKVTTICDNVFILRLPVQRLQWWLKHPPRNKDFRQCSQCLTSGVTTATMIVERIFCLHHKQKIGVQPCSAPKNVCTTSKTNDPAPLSCKWGQL